MSIAAKGANQPKWLAERAGMSRSTFALKFKETVRESPMEYLTRWRMLLAGDRLANSSDPISVIACARCPRHGEISRPAVAPRKRNIEGSTVIREASTGRAHHAIDERGKRCRSMFCRYFNTVSILSSAREGTNPLSIYRPRTSSVSSSLSFAGAIAGPLPWTQADSQSMAR